MSADKPAEIKPTSACCFIAPSSSTWERKSEIASRTSASFIAIRDGENDLGIASTALRYGWPLVTRDKTFARVPGLKVVGC